MQRITTGQIGLSLHTYTFPSRLSSGSAVLISQHSLRLRTGSWLRSQKFNNPGYWLLRLTGSEGFGDGPMTLLRTVKRLHLGPNHSLLT